MIFGVIGLVKHLFWSYLLFGVRCNNTGTWQLCVARRTLQMCSAQDATWHRGRRKGSDWKKKMFLKVIGEPIFFVRTNLSFFTPHLDLVYLSFFFFVLVLLFWKRKNLPLQCLHLYLKITLHTKACTVKKKRKKKKMKKESYSWRFASLNLSPWCFACFSLVSLQIRQAANSNEPFISQASFVCPLQHELPAELVTCPRSSGFY